MENAINLLDNDQQILYLSNLKNEILSQRRAGTVSYIDSSERIDFIDKELSRIENRMLAENVEIAHDKQRETDIQNLVTAVLDNCIIWESNPNGADEYVCVFCGKTMCDNKPKTLLKHTSDCAYLIAKDLQIKK